MPLSLDHRSDRHTSKAHPSRSNQNRFPRLYVPHAHWWQYPADVFVGIGLFAIISGLVFLKVLSAMVEMGLVSLTRQATVS